MKYKHAMKTITFSVALVCSLTTTESYASSVYVAVDSYEYKTELGMFGIDYRPAGMVVGASIDLNPNLYAQLEIGKWDDSTQTLESGSVSEFDSDLVNIGVGYQIENWNINASYTKITDELRVRHGRKNEFLSTGDIESMSLRLSAEYEKVSGRWAKTYSLGLQYDDSDTMALFDQENQMVMQSNDALFAMAKFNADYFFASPDKSKDSRGWYLGGNLSWYQEVSSTESGNEFRMGNNTPPPPPPGSGGNGANGNGGNNGAGNGSSGGVNINRTFGDSFGIAGAYATYQFDKTWSLDISASAGFAGDRNANSYAVTLSSAF